jgi:peptidyl-prolyl cis-trans isomerase A (cyclophilin A)
MTTIAALSLLAGCTKDENAHSTAPTPPEAQTQPPAQTSNPTPNSNPTPTQAALPATTAAAPAGHFMQEARDGKDLYATIETSMGTIVAQLQPKDAPIAVENFVGLATGEKEWTTPQGEHVHKPLYDGTLFHRVIPGFMIQGGDPMGTGRGGPGFTIPDDFPNQHGLHFLKGTLGMARTSMPNSGGCQFFIDVAPAPNLDNGYTIFGHVLSGQDVADKISQVPRGAMDRPITDVKINKITISDKR